MAGPCKPRGSTSFPPVLVMGPPGVGLRGLPQSVLAPALFLQDEPSGCQRVGGE